MRTVILHDRLDRPGSDVRADERDALVQADAVAGALTQLGHEALTWPIDLDLARLRADLRDLAPGVAFNLVEAVEGEARVIHLVPALLEELGIPFTGAGSEAMLLTSQKLLAKQRMVARGIPTPVWRRAGDATRRSGTRTRDGGGGDGNGDDGGADHGNGHPRQRRWIVKPVWEDGSVGIDEESIAASGADLDTKLAARERRFGEVFAEAWIEGREFNISLLEMPDGVRCLPPAEILFEGFPSDKPRMVGYAAKWLASSFEWHATPRRFDFAAADRALLDELMQISRACWDAFDLGGLARVDLRVDEHGRPWVLEINANPCLAPDAGFAAAAARADIDLAAVVGNLLDAALARAAVHGGGARRLAQDSRHGR